MQMENGEGGEGVVYIARLQKIQDKENDKQPSATATKALIVIFSSTKKKSGNHDTSS